VLDGDRDFLFRIHRKRSFKSKANPFDLIRLLTRLRAQDRSLQDTTHHSAGVVPFLRACLDSGSRIQQHPVIFPLRLRAPCSSEFPSPPEDREMKLRSVQLRSYLSGSSGSASDYAVGGMWDS